MKKLFAAIIVIGIIFGLIACSKSSTSTNSGKSSSNDATYTTCFECDGTGVCNHCDGEGIRIYERMGVQTECAKCDGSGVCYKCEGSGKIKAKNQSSSDYNSNYNKSSSNICTHCSGTGYSSKLCTVCGGTGIDPGYEDYDNDVLKPFYEKTCYKCLGSGYQKCSYCYGTGTD